MRYALLMTITLCSLVGAAAWPANPVSPRERVRMDAGWRFHRGEIGGAGNVGGAPITAWRWRKAEAAEFDAGSAPAPGGAADWRDATVGSSVFSGAPQYAWFETTLPDARLPKEQVYPVLHFEDVDDNAIVFLNGKRLARHVGWGEPFDVPLRTAWNPNGANVVSVLVENTGGGGGIMAPVSLLTAPPTAGGAAAPGYEDADWAQVHLPHDFVVDTPFDQTADRNHGYHPFGVGWYRKTFTLPASDRGKRLSIEFDGVYRNSRVWLNGHYLGQHASGYTSFAYDATAAALPGQKNVLVVRADCTSNEGWWYEGGGIYRHVWLVRTAPVHVAHWGTYVSTHMAEPGATGAGAAQVTVQTTVANDGAAASHAQLVSELRDPSGRTAARMVHPCTVAAGQSATLTQTVTLPHPLLWSLETPRLYTLVTRIESAGRTEDLYETPFGIRTIRFDANQGFFLNGKHVKIQGTCNHQDFAGIGVALPDRIHLYKLQKLKQLGSNGYRCSHHPYAPELMDYCDRIGMLVMDENRRLGDSPEILGQVESMVLRDRNHPSVIMWSMCNEESKQGTPEGAAMFTAMRNVVWRYDTTRPVSCAMNGGWGEGISLVQDLQGFNYYPGNYDAYHAKFPNQPVFGSETASTVCTRGEYEDDKERGYVTEFHDTDYTWSSVAERPFMAGSFVWTGFDYRGEPSPYDWPCINSHFGILDTCGFPKENYWYYQAWWKTAPVVHLMPHWTWPGREGKAITVRCFSNCERVELFVNGQSQGVRDMPRFGHIDWQTTYQPGKIEARGYNGSQTAAVFSAETAGDPTSIELKPAATRLDADGEDMAVVEVNLHDAAGRIAPTAGNLIRFTVTGPAVIAGVGNGDPSSHEPDQASERHAFNGHCLVILRATRVAGPITLTATADGLRAATITLKSLSSATRDVE